MLSAGGSDGGTDWTGMSIEMMRALVQNPNIEAHYELLTGWRRSYELVSDQMMQVQSYRDNLAAVWPPDKSAASSIYLSRLDEMIANLNETYEAALANHDAFASATLSISLAQHDFEKIWQEHEANKSKLAEYQNDVAMSSAATFDTTPPVTAMQQEAVRRKAITLMSSVSSDLALAQVRIVRPTPYQPPTMIEKSSTLNPGTRGKPQQIPPIVPNKDFGGSAAMVRGGSALVSPAADAGAASSGSTSQPSYGSHQPGLVLGGNSPSGTTQPSVGNSPVGSEFSNNNTVNPITTPAPPLRSGPLHPRESAPATKRSKPLRGVPAEGTVRSTTGVPASGDVRAMPHGGLIGGTLGGGPGHSGPAQPSTRRINPIGGMIGDGESAARTGAHSFTARGTEQDYGNHGLIAPGGRASAASENPARTGSRGAVSEPFYRQSTGRKSGQSGRSKVSRWDPDNPWEIAEGVAPVLQPQREQAIDPGPAIGLG